MEIKSIEDIEKIKRSDLFNKKGVPKCTSCGTLMEMAIDSITKKKSKYNWKWKCKCVPEEYRLGIL